MEVVGCFGSGPLRLKEGDLVLTARSEAPLKAHHTFVWIFFFFWSAPVRSVSSSIAPSAQAGVSMCAKLIHTSLAFEVQDQHGEVSR